VVEGTVRTVSGLGFGALSRLYGCRVRILVTNDDGIQSEGLHVLAREMRHHGEVVVAAPDQEFSGSGASLGALNLIRPEIEQVSIAGIDESWSVTGPPALIVFLARFGALGDPFDLIVSGINPGCNVGRAVYHSGTVGATLTGRNGGLSGVAVSQSAKFSIVGQAYQAELDDQKWQTAASVAGSVVAGLVTAMPTDPAIVNVNVPNVPLDELKGWRRGAIETALPGGVTTATRTPKPERDGVFEVAFDWGDRNAELLPAGSDSRAVEDGYAAISWLSRITDEHRDDTNSVDVALDRLLGGHAD